METPSSVVNVNCSDIKPFKEQPRKYFEKKSMQKLQDSIKTYGQEKPGEVKPLPQRQSHKYELVDGERRWLCCVALGIPFRTIVRSDLRDDKSHFLASFLANGGQENLADLETINAIDRIKKDFSFTNEQVAERIGRSEDWVAERAALAKLDPKLLEMMSPERKEGRLPFSHASLILKIPASQRGRIAEIVIRDSLKTSQIRDMIQKDPAVQAKSGYEFRKLVTLMRRVLEDSEALKQKKNDAQRVLKSRTNKELAKMMERLELATANLAEFKKALEDMLKNRKDYAA